MQNTDSRPAVILASTSRYRQQLLHKLRLPFTVFAPNCDETPLAGEPPEELVTRLALSKARSVHTAKQNDKALIIGSDQCATLNGQIIGKPGTHERAIEQLKTASGHTVRFLTGLCLFDTRDQSWQRSVVVTDVVFRHLSDHEIDRYLRTEQPYDCAGSFKSEDHGITLFDRIQGDDPNALIGLPLIELYRMLRACGLPFASPSD